MDTTGSVDVVGTGPEQVTMDKLLEDLRRVIVGVGFDNRRISVPTHEPAAAGRSNSR